MGVTKALLPLLFLTCLGCEAANILCPIWFVAPSHFVMYERLFKELAARGHNVTVLSHFPLKKPVPNYNDISIAGSLPLFVNNVSMELIEEFRGPLAVLWDWKEVTNECRTVYSLPEVKKLVHSTDHYDLVIAEVFFADCMVAFAHKFRAPLVGIMSSMAFPWAHDRIGNPDNPAYAESYYFPPAAPFTFWQRVQSTIQYLGYRLGSWVFSERVVDEIVRDAFGDDTPPTSELVLNTSLLLVNSHWSVNQPIPRVPGFIEVGGLHVKEPRPLPPDLQKFLDDSPQGVVYFSLGSMVRCDTFAPDILKAVLDVFSSLPQRVLWKVDPEKLPRLPPNVRAQEWLPQNDVLNHPNVRVFITHSGLMGTQEAVVAGVPLLSIPMFGDQFVNGAKAVAKGHGLLLNYEDITQHSLRAALDALINDTRYRDRARELSRLFLDRPRSALDEAVYWVEYVLRHRGAPHLRSAALDLSWYQYLLLDVAAFALAVIVAVIALLIFVARRLMAAFSGRPAPPASGKLKTK